METLELIRTIAEITFFCIAAVTCIYIITVSGKINSAFTSINTELTAFLNEVSPVFKDAAKTFQNTGEITDAVKKDYFQIRSKVNSLSFTLKSINNIVRFYETKALSSVKGAINFASSLSSAVKAFKNKLN